MDPRAFCSQSRVLIVAGKGGVGKTTVSASLALTAARAGLRTLLVDVEATGRLPALFGRSGPLGYEPVVLHPASGDGAEIVGRSIAPDAALVDYLDDHGLRRVSKRMSTTGTLDLVATAIPGIKDILVLGKIKQLAGVGGSDHFDLLVVDAPAAGHAVTFLASASGMADAIGVGPIRHQAAEVIDLITDPHRCQVLLVTLPEETPVNEVVETAFHLEDRAGVALAPVVVNALLPTLDLPDDARRAARSAGRKLTVADARNLDAAAAFRRRRQELQAEQLARLSDALPLPQLHLPFVWTSELGTDQVDDLAAALAGAIGGLPDSHGTVPA